MSLGRALTIGAFAGLGALLGEGRRPARASRSEAARKAWTTRSRKGQTAALARASKKTLTSGRRRPVATLPSGTVIRHWTGRAARRSARR